MEQQQQGPYFSVIIPTYNREATICRAVKSVQDQTFTDFEVLIIDDGSTDSTKSELEPLLSDEKIRYIYQDNAERSAARNNGIEKAIGKFITFLDSDDEYEKNHLESFQKTIQQHKEAPALYYCNGIFNVDGVITKYENVPLNEGDSGMEHLLTKGAIGTVFACLPSAVLKNYRFNENISVGEDKELWSRILLDHPLIQSNHHTVMVYEHDGRTVSAGNTRSALESLKTIKYIRKNLAGKVPDRITKKAVAANYYTVAKAYRTNEKRLAAIWYAFLSLVTFQDKYSKSIMAFIYECIFRRAY